MRRYLSDLYAAVGYRLVQDGRKDTAISNSICVAQKRRFKCSYLCVGSASTLSATLPKQCAAVALNQVLRSTFSGSLKLTDTAQFGVPPEIMKWESSDTYRSSFQNGIGFVLTPADGGEGIARAGSVTKKPGLVPPTEYVLPSDVFLVVAGSLVGE